MITFAEARERVLDVLDASPDTFFDTFDVRTYFKTADAFDMNNTMPMADYVPSCALGQAFTEVFQPIAASRTTSSVMNVGEWVNGSEIRIVWEQFLGEDVFDEDTVSFLEDVQELNDEGIVWREIAEWVRTNYPAPASTPSVSFIKNTLTTV